MLQGCTQVYGTYTQLVNDGIDVGSLVQEKKNTFSLAEEGTAKSEESNIECELYLYSIFLPYIIVS